MQNIAEDLREAASSTQLKTIIGGEGITDLAGHSIRLDEPAMRIVVGLKDPKRNPAVFA